MELKPFIALSVVNLGDDDGLILYRLALSNGETATTLEFWAPDDEFREFGEQLKLFPQTVESRVAFQLGEEDLSSGLGAGWAYFLKLEVFCYQQNGASAIRVQVKKPDEVPYHYSCEFFLQAFPAGLNSLGQKLCGWNPRAEQELVWVPSVYGV